MCYRFSIAALAFLMLPFVGTTSGQTPDSPPNAEANPAGEANFNVRDKLRRSTPASTYRHFLHHAREGRFDVAAEYLDLDSLGKEEREATTPEETARAFFVVLNHLLASPPETLNNNAKGNLNDGLPASLEWLTDIYVDGQIVELLMRRSYASEEGYFIWQFSADTIRQLPILYQKYGYTDLEKGLAGMFSDRVFLGVEAWTWILLLVVLIIGILIASLVTYCLRKVIRPTDPDVARVIRGTINGPLFLLIIISVNRFIFSHIQLNAVAREWVEVAALPILAAAWLVSRLSGLAFIYYGRRLKREGREVAAILLRPMLTLIRFVWMLSALLYVFHRAGFNITTMIAGLGIGGMAVALASQDTLKNIFGSFMILADKPFTVGQRIIAAGHDGVVEEIGVRSTKLRLLTVHLTSIPNDIMARIEIENIGLRPFIRRLCNIALPFDTSPEKLEEAVQIAKEEVENHDGQSDAFPPRVYLSDMNTEGFNLLIIYWYHPADYWGFQAFNQRFNITLARRFREAGIRFALPASDTYIRDIPTQATLNAVATDAADGSDGLQHPASQA